MKLSNTALFYRMEREKAMYWLSTKKAKIIMLLPTLMIYAVFIIIPVFIAFYYSFTDYSGLGKASFVGIKNYVAMFHDKLFLIALKNTFLVLLFSVIFLIVGSFMAALLMNKNFHGNAFFKMVIFAPYVIAPIIIGIIWGYILNPNYGLVNSVLHKIGLDMLAIEWIVELNGLHCHWRSYSHGRYWVSMELFFYPESKQYREIFTKPVILMEPICYNACFM